MLTSFTRLAVTASSAMMLASSLKPKIAGDHKENGEEKRTHHSSVHTMGGDQCHTFSNILGFTGDQSGTIAQ
jgi:hypothetical protein